MSSKKCIYSNCTNTGAGEITLFAFPKDPARRNLWLQHSGRSGHTLQKSDCLCELHFSSRFISSNQRRKVLVGASVPNRFEQTDNEDHQIEALDECEKLDMQEMFEDDEQREEIEDYSAMEHEEQVSVEDYSPETIVCDDGAVDHNENKRKFKEVRKSTQNGDSQPVKLIKIGSSNSIQKNGVEASRQQYGRDEKQNIKPITNIIDHPDVSIFNIRGEEFIQMPKSLYVEEKCKLENTHKELYAHEVNRLREELIKYKNVVQLLRNELKKLP